MKEIKTGSTHLLTFRIDEDFDIDAVKKVIFTLKNEVTGRTVTKTYPDGTDVMFIKNSNNYSDGFLIQLTQEDTVTLSHKKTSLVDIEGQVIYVGNAVGFTKTAQLIIIPSLSYELVDGALTSYDTVSNLDFDIVGDIVTVDSGDIDVPSAVENYLNHNPISLQEQDYQAIAQVVINMLKGEEPEEPQPEEPEPVRLSYIRASKTKIEYQIGDTLNTDDITITAYYSDGSNRTVHGAIDTSNVDMNVEGTYSIIVRFGQDDIVEADIIAIMVVNNSSGITHPEIPQQGYWQFKTTPTTKYFILGTDDSTGTDAIVYRLLRSYGFKYTCNVIADYLDRTMYSDDIDVFTENDASNLLANNSTVRNFLMFASANNDIEIALHGKAEHHLVNSNKFTDTIWGSVYQSYVSAGGQQSLSDFKVDLLDKIKENDLAQGASHVETSRQAIEEVTNLPVVTAGIWGGDGTVTIDGITLDLSAINDINYDWRAHNYTASATNLVGKFTRGNRPLDYIHNLQRDSGGFGNFLENYELMNEGDCIELFGHQMDISAESIANIRQYLDVIKSYVDQEKVTVVTRKEYASLGEYVSNPITRIAATRNGTLVVGTSDLDSDYTVTATLLDGTTETISSGFVIDRSNLDTTTLGTYSVRALYKGFTVTVSVEVTVQQEEVTTEPSIKSLPTGTISPKFYQGYSLTANGAWDKQTPNPDALNGTSDAYEITSTDTITVSTTNGYPFSGFFYSDTPFSRSKKIADITINTGDNVLTIPDGAQYFCLRWHGKSYEFEDNVATITIIKGV